VAALFDDDFLSDKFHSARRDAEGAIWRRDRKREEDGSRAALCGGSLSDDAE
jgi:hypothetical protein